MPSPPAARFAINLIEDERHRLLLLLRNKTKQMGPGLWGLPAGHIEPGESPEECSRRENREELGEGFIVAPIKRHPPVRDTFYGGQYEIHLFHYRYVSGDVRLNEEHTAFAWVAAEEFRNYPVMDGIDEDIFYLGIWPREFLRPEKLPRR
jgi:8-oxo-dGTP pyrophosphatase MutT (NUDIX family)